MMAPTFPIQRNPLLLITLLTFGTAMAACSDEQAPDRSSPPTGTGGSSSGDNDAAGTAGSAATAGSPDNPIEGVAGQPNPSIKLPAGCVPDDMPFVCNPMTNEGCDTAKGQACDYGLDEVFVCYERANDVQEGGACNWETGPFCARGLTCDGDDPEDYAGTCKPHCCENKDCEAGKTCVPMDPEFGTVGTCR